jgi:hypothetical protein
MTNEQKPTTMNSEQQKPATPATNPASPPQQNQGSPSPQQNQGTPSPQQNQGVPKPGIQQK